MGNTRLKSTCPNDDDHQWSFHRIHNLYYGITSYQNLSLYRMHLDNIRSLDLTIPIDNSLWWIVSTFDRLHSLNVTSNSDMNSSEIQSNLQILLDRSPNLVSLKFFSWFVQIEFPLHIKHSTIRRLYLQGPNMIYNHEQCIELYRSLIGQQCEVLSITVKERTDIIDLVNNMKNLRALIVQCIQSISKVNEEKNLIHWLQQRLPITCSISNTIEPRNSFRLWIR